MAKLSVTLIDVGHGDCIFIETEDSSKDLHFALIDCPDSRFQRPGFLYVKRRVERLYPDKKKRPHPIFEFVMMTHSHKDHCLGLSRIIKEFGCKAFLHGRMTSGASSTHVLSYVKRTMASSTFLVDSTTPFPVPSLGVANLTVLYPDSSPASISENDNSVVLAIEQDGISVLLTGDIENGCWSAITVPSGTEAIKAPHHGASNATISSPGISPWVPLLTNAKVGISCHSVPHGHPDPASVALIELSHTVYRTDLHGDVSFCIENGAFTVKCWQ